MTLEIVTNLPKNENDLLSFGLDELAGLGAKKILSQALLLETDEYINAFKDQRDANGRRLVVKNGKARSRKVTMGSGTINVQAPRVNDKRAGKKFESKILPPYLRRSPNVESILPLLYLKGLSGNAFKEALEKLLGDEAAGLSSSSISILKKQWQQEFKDWKRRDILEDFVYLWCDGVNFKVRLGDDKRASLLVVIGVNSRGEKKLLAAEGGYRESKESWKTLFLDLESRGLKSPLLLLGDGALGLWSCVRELELFKETKEQRCWFHKMANVLNILPKRVHGQAKSLLKEMMMAPSKAEADRQLAIFHNAFADKYEKACICLSRDWEPLTNFFNFPAMQWSSLRTTNPIESAFASVKQRTLSSKGAGSVAMAEGLAFKLLKECEKKWRPIRGYKEIEKQLAGMLYKDGILVEKEINQEEAI